MPARGTSAAGERLRRLVRSVQDALALQAAEGLAVLAVQEEARPWMVLAASAQEY